MRIPLPLPAAIVMEIILPGFSFYFDITAKVVLLLAGTAVVLAAWNGSMPRLGREAKWVVVFLGVEMLWLGVATAFSSHPAFSLYLPGNIAQRHHRRRRYRGPATTGWGNHYDGCRELAVRYGYSARNASMG